MKLNEEIREITERIMREGVYKVGLHEMEGIATHAARLETVAEAAEALQEYWVTSRKGRPLAEGHVLITETWQEDDLCASLAALEEQD